MPSTSTCTIDLFAYKEAPMNSLCQSCVYSANSYDLNIGNKSSRDWPVQHIDCDSLQSSCTTDHRSPFIFPNEQRHSRPWGRYTRFQLLPIPWYHPSEQGFWCLHSLYLRDNRQTTPRRAFLDLPTSLRWVNKHISQSLSAEIKYIPQYQITDVTLLFETREYSVGIVGYRLWAGKFNDPLIVPPLHMSVPRPQVVADDSSHLIVCPA